MIASRYSYRQHPRIERFRALASPVGFLAEYLRAVHAESVERGYRFDASRTMPERAVGRIDVPCGQLEFEWGHRRRKTDARAPDWRDMVMTTAVALPHPLFRVVTGGSRTGSGRRLDGSGADVQPVMGKMPVSPAPHCGEAPGSSMADCGRPGSGSVCWRVARPRQRSQAHLAVIRVHRGSLGRPGECRPVAVKGMDADLTIFPCGWVGTASES